MDERRSYNEEVKVFLATGAELGTAHFIGSASRPQESGVWGWRGRLEDLSFDPAELAGIKLRLQFLDGAEGTAICLEARPIASSGSQLVYYVRLEGVEMPPRTG